MNRQIKFRGLRLDNKEWVCGSLITLVPSQTFIVPEWSNSDIYDGAAKFRHCYEVDPATVGQFTGLLDKSGKEIYEGDILKDAEAWQIIFDIKHAKFGYAYLSGIVIDVRIYVDGSRQEVVGNIHQNSELLADSGE